MKVTMTHRMFVAMFCCLAMTTVTATQNKRVTQVAVGREFASISKDFNRSVGHLHKRNDTRGNDVIVIYDPREVNHVLESARSSILEQVPADDLPFRSFIDGTFPKPLPLGADIALDQDVQPRIDRARSLFKTLTSVTSLRLNLVVNSMPSGAQFELAPTVGERFSGTTNDLITNIYRGPYQYVIAKAGYHAAHGSINFIERAGSTLDCQLFPESDSSDQSFCRLK